MLSDSMRHAQVKFQEAYHGLNWDYMSSRDNGELILDIGITVHPINETPLVGLWRLDCLEASYGAGGYRSGNIHTINTLSMYGALQAQSLPSRRKQTHISFRSSYPQAYEATRQQDNSRGFFNEKNLYNRSQLCAYELDSIRNIYNQTACKQSYGVRDEFRICSDAINDVLECIDESVGLLFKLLSLFSSELKFKVKAFHATKPVIWIPSQLWFSFLSRRLGILDSVHKQIFRKQPPNYGVLTGLFAYLMQSVIFTPPRVDTYIRESLALLRYKQNCARFGMFFLDSLDLNTSRIIPEVLERDDDTVLRILGHVYRKPQIPMATRQEEDMEVFPLGKFPTWKEISKSLGLNPTVLIKKWSGLPGNLLSYQDINISSGINMGSLKEKAISIFIDFTAQIWASLNNRWRLEPEFEIAPKTLEAALNIWTVDFVLTHCAHPNFHACNTGIFNNVPGRPVLSFSKRRKTYFPPERKTAKEKYWEYFTEEPGYINSYWNLKDSLETLKAKDELDQRLESFLSACQCLPDSVRSTSTNQIWHPQRQQMVILTNPDFYSIEGVGKKADPANKDMFKEQRAPPAHKTRKDTIITILGQKGYNTSVANRAYNMKANSQRRKKNFQRSGKAKNKRVPPKRKEKESLELTGNNLSSKNREEIFSDEDEEEEDQEGCRSGDLGDEDEEEVTASDPESVTEDEDELSG